MTHNIISFAEIASRNKALADISSGILKLPSLITKPKIITSSIQPIQIPVKKFSVGPSPSSGKIWTGLEDLLLVFAIGIGVGIVANEIEEYLENQKLNKK
jgi:hypothetical protein